MHFIQKHILDELRTRGATRYSALQPDGIESSHFRYHLKDLERTGYVQSPSRGLYELTTKGQRYVDRLSRNTVNLLNMPKVITYTLLTQGDTYLLQRKDREPYRGLLNMIGGKVHEGETTMQASQREVAEKTNLHIENPTLAGVFEVIIRTSEHLLTHAIAYVYTAEIQQDAAANLTAMPKQSLATTPDLAPDTLAIIASLNTKIPPIKTLFITV